MSGSNESNWIVFTITHIAEIEPPKIREIPKLRAIAPADAIIDNLLAASSFAADSGSTNINSLSFP